MQEVKYDGTDGHMLSGGLKLKESIVTSSNFIIFIMTIHVLFSDETNGLI
jgi:hypothetical protein